MLPLRICHRDNRLLLPTYPVKRSTPSPGSGRRSMHRLLHRVSYHAPRHRVLPSIALVHQLSVLFSAPGIASPPVPTYLGAPSERALFLGTPTPPHALYTPQLIDGCLYFQIFPTPDDLQHAFQRIHSAHMSFPDQRAEKQTIHPLRYASVS
jgi:hypothetical protein